MRRFAIIAALSTTAFVVAGAVFYVAAFRSTPAQAGLQFQITVNTTVDEDTAIGTSCSLREAIVTANTDTNYNDCAVGALGDNTNIVFDIGSGAPVINISSSLPTITDNATINGNTGGASFVELRGPGGTFASGQHGLNITAPDTTISNLIIRSFRDNGIRASGANLKLTGNRIGTTADGSGIASNAGNGVHVSGQGTIIGGTTNGGPCSGTCNLISGNLKDNVLIDVNADGSTMVGNFIGTDVSGTLAFPGTASFHGVHVLARNVAIGRFAGTTPGGPCTGDCNLIASPSASSQSAGIRVDASASGTGIHGNFIGTDVTGTARIGLVDVQTGIIVLADNVSVGAVSLAGEFTRNVISGNAAYGLLLIGNSASVEGNYFGTNSAGTAAIPSSGDGIQVQDGVGSFIGASNPGAGNLISGASTNNGAGVLLYGGSGTQVLGNLIGTAADGVSPLPNSGSGVHIRSGAHTNQVGGTNAGEANVIAFNGENGVLVNGFGGSANNSIRGNSIFANAEQGIALVDMVTELTPPVITGLGSIHGTACPNCIIDIYSDAEDEGRIHEGSATADGSGDWTFDGPLSGPFVTATATDANGNTSEFSAPFDPTPPTPTPSPSPSPSPSPTPTGTPGPQRKQGDINCDALITEDDVYALFRFVAGLSNGEQPSPCPDIGDPEATSGFPWGDLNCDNALNAKDVLYLLAFRADILLEPVANNCFTIGQVMT